jgi:hypothetical protein
MLALSPLEYRVWALVWRCEVNAFDMQNEVRRRKAEAKAAGDAYMQRGDFNRPRRRFFLGALLAAVGRRLRAARDEVASAMTPRQKADQSPL